MLQELTEGFSRRNKKQWPNRQPCEKDLSLKTPYLSLREEYVSNPTKNGYLRYPDGLVKIPYPHVIAFDVDGVLANAPYFHEYVAVIFLERIGALPHSNSDSKLEVREEIVYRLAEGLPSGVDHWDYCRHATQVLGLKLDTDEMLREIERELVALRNFPLVSPKALDLLSRTGVQLALMTNRDRADLDIFLVESGLGSYFMRNGKLIAVTREMGRKPEAVQMEALLGLIDLKELKVEGRPNILMIGDTLTDLRDFQENSKELANLLPIALHRPGKGYCTLSEDALQDWGAMAVYPSAPVLIKDCLRSYGLMIGDKNLALYQEMKLEARDCRDAVESYSPLSEATMPETPKVGSATSLE